ncbi:MAG: glycosyltransferase family 9 protein [Puniceicoccales bacterium]|jgi:ADP-heptose:LPS heptosyltransferase|nr:glycosyltransferase family 9 protein [Puniceicoccales bacterium]
MAQRLLVIKPSSLGDVVHALVVIQTLHRHRVDMEVDWVIRHELTPVIVHSGLVNEIYKFHRSSGIRSFFQLIRKIRKISYDFIWDMQGLARSGIITHLARAKRKIGRKDSRECSFLAYHECIGFTSSQAKREHAVTILSHFLPTLGLNAQVDGTVHWRSISDASDDIAPYIALFPETRGKGKEWPYFPMLARNLLRCKDFPATWKLKIFGTRKNPPFEPHPRLEDLRGQTHLEQLLSSIQFAHCIVANDSGPVHIAASMRVPVVGLYGPTSAQRFGPYPLTYPSNTYLQAPDGDLKALPVNSVMDKIIKIAFK